MKITIETTEKVTKELEVKLPYYSRYNNLFYYKVIAKDLMLKVTIESNGHCQIDLSKYLIDTAFRSEAVEIDSTEFDKVLAEVTNNLINS